MKVAENSQSRPFLEIQDVLQTGSGCLRDVHHTTLQFVLSAVCALQILQCHICAIPALPCWTGITWKSCGPAVFC